LAEHFLEKFSREFGKPGARLSDDAKQRILDYRWPGNVRELQNAIERAVILSDGPLISADTLQLQPQRPESNSVPSGMLPPTFCSPMPRIKSHSSSGWKNRATELGKYLYAAASPEIAPPIFGSTFRKYQR